MTKIINQIRNKPWKYLFDSKVMSIFINNIFNIINIMKRNSFFYTKNNVTSLTKEYNKYQKSPNEKILLTSSMLNKKPLTQYKEIIYYNTEDANSVEHLNLNHSICVKSLSSRRKIPMRIQSKQSFPQIEKVKNKKSVNMILCGEGMKKEIQREKEAIIKRNSVKIRKVKSNFKEMTMSTMFKNDHKWFKVNSKMRSKVDDKLRSLIQEKRIDVIEEESKKEGKNIILEQLMNLLQNNYGNGKKTKENYVRRLDKEIKDSIKSNEYRVKDTMDNLRRLQRDNDENLNKVSFIMKIAFKA